MDLEALENKKVRDQYRMLLGVRDESALQLSEAVEVPLKVNTRRYLLTTSF